MSLGVLLDRRHRPQVLFVERPDDQRPQGTEDDRHSDVQDEPPDDLRAAAGLLEGVVDVNVDRRLESADLNCGGKFSDPDDWKPVTDPHQSFPGSPGFQDQAALPSNDDAGRRPVNFGVRAS
ncbi:MAG TPA: hypothetical protein VIJ51_12305 [Solirubrobacteraceae bacterium]